MIARKNNAFGAKIVNTRLTKGFMAIFAPAESLPSPATLLHVTMSHTSHEDMVILKGQKSPTLLTQKLFMANFASLQSFPSEKISSNDVELHHISQVTCAEATKNMYQHTSNQNVQIFHLGVTYLGYTRQFLSSRFNTEKTLVLPPQRHKNFGNRENVLK